MKAHSLICKKKEYQEIKKAFFIDRDYEPLKTDIDNLYQTPCYSIENFYVTESCFSKIINIEFGINYDEEDFKKCVSDFNARKIEFHNYTRFLNTWLSCQRSIEEKENEKRIKLSNFKVARVFSKMEIDNIKIKEEININNISNCFPNNYNVDIELFEKHKKIFEDQQSDMFFRGKFEMEFLQKIIDSLISKNKEGTYFQTSRSCVSINPHVNPLSTFSKYADTPDDLKIFLKQYLNSDITC